MNWTSIIEDLSSYGYTQQALAERCGCAQSTISELLRGDIKNPNYLVGRCLVELHEASKILKGAPAQ